MTFYGVLVVAIGFGLSLWAAQREALAGGRFLALPLLYVWHTGMVVAYWLFSRGTIVDATGYYELGQYTDHPGIGTDLIMWATGLMRDALPGEHMLDIALIYGLFSFSGLVFFLRTASTLAGPAYPSILIWVYPLAFMPGMSFWTSAIGKDAPMFLAILLTAFGACRPRERWGYIAAGLAIALPIRPQIAVVMGLGAASAFLLASNIRGSIRLAGLLAILLAGAVAAPFAASYLHVESLDREYLSDYVADTQRGLEIGGSAVEMEHYSFPVQVFSYLYRPAIIESGTPIQRLAAVENTVLLGLTFALIVKLSQSWRAIFRQPALVFCATYFVVGVAASAVLTANLGMAERQKEQFMPCLFLMLIGVVAAQRTVAKPKPARAVYASSLSAYPGAS